MRLNDAVIGVVLMLFALAEMAYTRSFPTLHGQQFGPDLFPILIGIGLLGCGAILTYNGLTAGRSVPLFALGDWAREPGALLNFALVVLSLVFYIAVSDALGFVLTALIILTLLLLRFGVGVASAPLIAIAATLGIHWLFAKILLVPLPWGVLQPIAW
jgi:putative tricarboxylic transport membrane protein